MQFLHLRNQWLIWSNSSQHMQWGYRMLQHWHETFKLRFMKQNCKKLNFSSLIAILFNILVQIGIFLHKCTALSRCVRQHIVGTWSHNKFLPTALLYNQIELATGFDYSQAFVRPYSLGVNYVWLDMSWVLIRILNSPLFLLRIDSLPKTHGRFLAFLYF